MITTTLWRKWREQHDKSSRDRLIEHYRPFALEMARHMGRRLPPLVDREDMESAAYEGLIQAVEIFDPNRGIKFETLATTYVQGYIQHAVRRASAVPSSVRTRVRNLKRAEKTLEDELGRMPTDEEIASKAGTTVSSMAWDLAHVNVTRHQSLDIPIGDSEICLVETLVDPNANVESLAEMEAKCTALRLGLARLPERDRMVLDLHYWQGMPQAQIGKKMGTCQATASNLKRHALKQLRSELDNSLFVS